MEQIVSWLAPAATTLAALITASNLGSRTTGYGFAIFTVGSLAWLAQGYLTGQANLLWQNAILTALNLFGVWRWLGVRAKIEEGGRAAQEESQVTPGEALFPGSLLGRGTIVGRDGAELGRAVDAMIGCSSGLLSYIVAAEGGVAGVGETLRKVNWDDVRVEDDRFQTRMSPESFRALPMLDKDAWPG
jgi:hypothetical protein